MSGQHILAHMLLGKQVYLQKMSLEEMSQRNQYLKTWILDLQQLIDPFRSEYLLLSVMFYSLINLLFPCKACECGQANESDF